MTHAKYSFTPTITHPRKARAPQSCAALIAIGVALLGTGQVYASPAFTPNAPPPSFTDRAHANVHATQGCSNGSNGQGIQVITPQAGTELMPVDASTAPPSVEAFYSRAARQHVTWLSAVTCKATGRTHALPFSGNRTSAAEYSSPSWSGYVIGGSTATTIDYVQSGWYVPTVTMPTYPADPKTGGYSSVAWVGLGGVTGGYSNVEPSAAHPLIQAGTGHDIEPNGSPSYYFWYEIWPGEKLEQKIDASTLPVKPGDEVAAVITYLPSAQEGGMGVCNFSTNQCINFIATNTGEPSNTAEWIVEAPLNSNQATVPLANFGSVSFFNGCWAYTTSFSVQSAPLNNQNSYPVNGSSGLTGSITGTCQTIKNGPNLNVFEMLYSGALIAVPGSLGSNGSDFQVNYQ